MDDNASPLVRWAKLAIVIGALMLAAAVALVVWESAGDSPPVPVITGREG